MFLHSQLIDNIQLLKDRPYLDRKFLHQKYVFEGLSIRQIASEIGFSKNTIRNALINFKIPLREASRHQKSSVSTYGFKRIGGKILPHLTEQKVLNAIIDLRENQKLSYPQIAKFSNSTQVPTKTRSKKGWQPETVRNIHLSILEDRYPRSTD